MQENAAVLFNRVRLFSTVSVSLAFLTSLIFSDSRKFATSHEYSETRPNLKAALVEAIKSTIGIDVEIIEQ